MRQSNQQVANDIVADVVGNGPGSAAQIAQSVGISLFKFYAAMVSDVNDAAERMYPGHRVLPPRRGDPYALVRRFRTNDPVTVLTRLKQSLSKAHRVAVELDVAQAGPIQQQLARDAQLLSMQLESLVTRVEDWVVVKSKGLPG